MNKKLLAGLALVGVTAGVYLAPKPQEYATCVSNKQELETVASIANATGQLPNGVRLATGERVSVNPNLCNTTFDYPKEVQTEAREVQGNTNSIQVGVNPQR